MRLTRFLHSPSGRAAAICAIALLLVSVSAGALALQRPLSATPIQHIVIIMMENQTYDHFFGTFPGVNSTYSLPLGSCQPTSLKQQSRYGYPACLYPFNADTFSSSMQENGERHGTIPERQAYDNGSMDRFVLAQRGPFANNTMSYITGATLPDYWDYASYYSLNVDFFSSTLSYSWPNHLYLLTDTEPSYCAGATAKCAPSYNLTLPNIVQAMNSTGVDWKYYQADWNDKNQCVPIVNNQPTGLTHFIHYWEVASDWPSIQDGQSTCHRIQNNLDLLSGIASGYLPQVSWVVPDHNESDHAGCGQRQGGVCVSPMSPFPAGQLFTSNIINAISSNPTLWKNTAIFLTWDDPGGYYDNVRPTQVDQFGYGFRAPLIVISPYVRQGISYGDGQQQDFTSFLSTIEHNWNLPSIGGRDATVGDLFYMFNFSQPPLSPLILPSNTLASYPLSTCTTCQYGVNLVPYQASAGIHFPPLQTNGTCIPVDDEGDPCD
jgi:phospholipase C